MFTRFPVILVSILFFASQGLTKFAPKAYASVPISTIAEFGENRATKTTIAWSSGRTTGDPISTGTSGEYQGNATSSPVDALDGQIKASSGSMAAATFFHRANALTKYTIQRNQVSAAKYGAIGDDSTDNTAALNACISASESSGGSLACYVPNGIYHTQRVQITSSARLICESAKAILKINTSSSPNNQTISISSRFNLSFKILGAFANGQTRFILPSVAGISVGQDVYLVFGQDPYDATQPQLAMFDRIKAITENSVTLTIPLPEEVTAPTTRSNILYTFAPGGEAQNVEISGCGFDMVSGVIPDSTIAINNARAVHLDDLTGYHIAGSLPLVAQSEDILIENIHIIWSQMLYADAGRAINGWESRGVTIRNVKCDKCENSFMSWEAETRGVDTTNVYWASPATSKATTAISIGGNSNGITIRRFTMNSAASPEPAVMSLADTSRASTSDFVLLSPVASFDLSKHSGSFTYRGTLYSKTENTVFTIPILPNQSAAGFALPRGYYKSMQVYASNTAGIKAVYLTTSRGGLEVHSALVPGTKVDLASTPSGSQLPLLGWNYSFSYPTKSGAYYTDGTVPADTYLTFTVEYYPDGIDKFTPTPGKEVSGPLMRK